MPLINCKVKLKLKWTKYCVLAAAGDDNTNDNPNDIIYTVKDTYISLPSLYQQKKTKNYQNFLAKDLKD